MPVKFFTTLLLLVGIHTASIAQSNLFIDNSISPGQMVMDFFNSPDIHISNVSFNGDSLQVAYFDASNTDLNLLAGLMLSSGSCVLAADSVGYFANAGGTACADSILATIQPGALFDLSNLEFDLVVDTSQMMCFVYRFGSEEYPEYVCTNFNDIFGFFVSGSGIGVNQNIATIPSTTLPVSINNINDGTNPCPTNYSQYYFDNIANNGTDCAYDGLTVTMTAKFYALAGETYHIKLALSDVGDGAWDSGVFIDITSLGGDSLLTPNAGLAIATDGNTVTFENNSHYATEWIWDFGDGSALDNARHPEPHTYANPDTYTVQLITKNFCCYDTVKTVVQIGSSSATAPITDKFNIAPNPTRDHLTISPVDNQAYSVQIRDISGKIIYQSKQDNTLIINTLSWAKGVYSLHIITGNAVYYQKIIVE